MIPKNRLNPDGVKILNWYPQPNAVGIDPSYNYQTSNSNTYPRREEIYRGRLQHQRQVEGLCPLHPHQRRDQHGVRAVERELQHSVRADEFRRAGMVVRLQRDDDHQPDADQ